MDKVATELCQALYKAARSPPGAGLGSLVHPQVLIGQLVEDGYDQTLVERAQETLGLLRDWAAPGGPEAMGTNPEELRGRVLNGLNGLLVAGLLDAEPGLKVSGGLPSRERQR